MTARPCLARPCRPLLASASGETLLLLVQNAELLAKCMPAAAAADVLPALLVRAAQHGERRARRGRTRSLAPPPRLHVCAPTCACSTHASAAVSPPTASLIFVAIRALLPRPPLAQAAGGRGSRRRHCLILHAYFYCLHHAGDVRAQEEALRRVAAMADTLDYEGLKQRVLPACHTLCLSTTSGACGGLGGGGVGAAEPAGFDGACGGAAAARPHAPAARAGAPSPRITAACLCLHPPPPPHAAAAVRVGAFAAMPRQSSSPHPDLPTIPPSPGFPAHCAAAAVRVSAFAAMSRLAQRMDQAEAEAMLATAAKARVG